MLGKAKILQAMTIVAEHAVLQKSGLEKIMADWKHVAGVHKPASGKEDEGVSETGEKVRAARSLREQGKEFQAQHAEQKAHIRHDDVIAQQKQMHGKEKPAETPKATSSDYATQAAPKVAGIQSKWGKVKEQLK